MGVKRLLIGKNLLKNATCRDQNPKTNLPGDAILWCANSLIPKSCKNSEYTRGEQSDGDHDPHQRPSRQSVTRKKHDGTEIS